MEFLQLEKIKKGLMSSHGKYTSLSSHWLRSKPKNKNEPKYKTFQASDNLYIAHYSLITMKYQRGKSESI